MCMWGVCVNTKVTVVMDTDHFRKTGTVHTKDNNQCKSILDESISLSCIDVLYGQ